MTYCLATRLSDGPSVFLSDSRTNAGVDNVGAPTRSCSSSTLSPTAWSSSSRPATSPPPRRSWTGSSRTSSSPARTARLPPAATCSRSPLPGPGEHRGRRSATVPNWRRRAPTARRRSSSGLIGTDPPDILLVCEGNYIRASEDRPSCRSARPGHGKVPAPGGHRGAAADRVRRQVALQLDGEAPPANLGGVGLPTTSASTARLLPGRARPHHPPTRPSSTASRRPGPATSTPRWPGRPCGRARRPRAALTAAGAAPWPRRSGRASADLLVAGGRIHGTQAGRIDDAPGTPSPGTGGGSGP